MNVANNISEFHVVLNQFHFLEKRKMKHRLTTHMCTPMPWALFYLLAHDIKLLITSFLLL